MCGIVGAVEQRSPRRDRLIQVMCQTMVHRGPDDQGEYGDDDAAIAMRRLSIIDIAHGAQPAFGENRDVVVVFNGELYNYRALQADLKAKGHELSSDSDTECIPHLYEEYGLSLIHI